MLRGSSGTIFQISFNEGVKTPTNLPSIMSRPTSASPGHKSLIEEAISRKPYRRSRHL